MIEREFRPMEARSSRIRVVCPELQTAQVVKLKRIDLPMEKTAVICSDRGQALMSVLGTPPSAVDPALIFDQHIQIPRWNWNGSVPIRLCITVAFAIEIDPCFVRQIFQ